MKNKHDMEIAEIQQETEKLRGDNLASQPGETVKLRKKSNKSAAELEIVVEQLKRVIDKQKIEIEKLHKNNEHLENQNLKRTNEPKLRMRIEQLERQVHSYEMQEINVDEKDKTIKKLIFANKTLREDLQREIDRYTMLETKFKQMLVKYNIKARENDRNQKQLFTMHTGAQMEKYDDFLHEPKSNFKSKLTDDPGDEAEVDIGMRGASRDDDYHSDDSLNNINRREAQYY